MELMPYLGSVAKTIDAYLIRNFGSAPDDLNQASAHLLVAGGKRLRPAVAMLSADAVAKGRSQDIFPAAIALELTHTFTLIHDDIMDGDSLRRGAPTVHTKWDAPTAILAGDVLYARAFEHICLAKAGDKAKVLAVAMLAKACDEICEGQHMDMSFEKRSDVSEGEYLEMVRKKTGALYAASAGIGGLLAGGSEKQVAALYQYGMNTGVAFQIQDDLIDLMASPEKSGKDRASDLREGKQTLIMIRARAAGLDLSEYRRELSNREIDEAITKLETAKIISGVRQTAVDLVDTGKKDLAVLPDSDERRLLGEISDYFVTRGH
ncbi:MAG: polyprenyl synthetase family protein [Methanoregulaceae archaeon]